MSNGNNEVLVEQIKEQKLMTVEIISYCRNIDFSYINIFRIQVQY